MGRVLMRRAALLLLAVAIAPGGARADDALILDGLLDVRAVHADTEPSYLYDGGIGPTRFDDNHDGLRLGRASLSARLRIADTVSATAVVDAYGDGEQNPVGVSEAFVQWRPFPINAIRWQVKAGAFFLPASLEHRLAGWTSPYTLSASALNTWLGEEFRVLGTEVEARWLGASSGYQGDIGLFAGVFGWDEGAGVIIAERGWALTDRPTLTDEQFNMNYSSWYALASVEHRADRVSVRYDKFTTEQLSGFYGPPPADETGHAVTIGWMHGFNEHWEAGAEWLRISSAFPPRAAKGFPPAATDTQIQLAVRYRFRVEAF
jgi:hypothetical protein